MKRVLLLGLLMCCMTDSIAEVRVETLETVEFMSALSRVAGYYEYCLENSSYAKDIDSYFQKYKNHEAIIYHQQLHSQYNIAYDAVASMAIHLEIKNNELSLLSNTDLLDYRWSNVDLKKALRLYNKFYKDTDFHNFYLSHKNEFDRVVQDYRDRVIMPYFHEEWYTSFYGVDSNENYWVVISFNGGGQNYGPSRQLPDGKREVFNVATFYPNNDHSVTSAILIHEFNHSFVNPLLENNSTNIAMMKECGEWMLSLSRWALSYAQAYGSWQTVINESIVRAAVIIYMLDNKYTAKQIDAAILDEVSRGFTWTPELVECLRYYADHRDTYKTLNDFYPELAKCLNDYVMKERSRLEECTSQPYQGNANSSNMEAINKVRVETLETVEFMSVMSRVAGYYEYCLENNSYAKDIDAWFQKYKDHEAIKYHQQLRSQYNIAYDAVASLAIHLEIENDELSLLPNTELLEDRWKNVNLQETLSLYNKFYKDTDFHNFYLNHKDEFDRMVQDYRDRVMPYFHEEWYTSFYGIESNDNYWIVISFNGGGQNYGPSRQLPDGKRDVFNVCTYYQNNDPSSTCGILIHEFNHSFVNPLLDNNPTNSAMMKDCGEWLYMLSSWAMSRAQAYSNWQTVINESVVRAAVIIYMLDNKYTAEQINAAVLDEVSRGFTWTPELVKCLRYYVENRDTYKTLSDFYPELTKCLNDYVEKERSRLENCTGMPPQETFNVAVDDVLFKFESNRDIPTTLTLVEVSMTDKKPIIILGTVNGYQVTKIDDYVFDQNQMLTKVTIQEGVESIGNNAFRFSSVEEVELPSTLKRLEHSAFGACPKMTKFHLPASVTYLGPEFLANNALKTLTVDKDNPIFDSRDNCNAVIETASNTLIQASLSTTIPQSVTAIGRYGFGTMQMMTSVTIPSWITSIGDNAFQHCVSLQTIYCGIEKPFPISEQTFLGVTENSKLYVPVGTKKLYQSTEGWNDFVFIEEMKGNIKGDVNGDNIVNVADIVEVINANNGMPSANYESNNADMNDDGVVNEKDIEAIINIIMKK